jgi:uncharacterized protein (TIGR02246 family)
LRGEAAGSLLDQIQPLEGAMGSTRVIVTMAVALFLILPRPISRAQDSSKTIDADSAAVRQVIADFSESFSRHDAHATAMTFAEDSDFTNMSGAHVHGREAIEKRFVPLYAGNLRAARRTDTVRSIRYITPQVAFVDADTVITGTKAPDGSDGPVRKGLMIVVLSKEKDRWVISNFHEAEYPPPRVAP